MPPVQNSGTLLNQVFHHAGIIAGTRAFNPCILILVLKSKITILDTSVSISIFTIFRFPLKGQATWCWSPVQPTPCLLCSLPPTKTSFPRSWTRIITNHHKSIYIIFLPANLPNIHNLRRKKKTSPPSPPSPPPPPSPDLIGPWSSATLRRPRGAHEPVEGQVRPRAAQRRDAGLARAAGHHVHALRGARELHRTGVVALGDSDEVIHHHVYIYIYIIYIYIYP